MIAPDTRSGKAQLSTFGFPAALCVPHMDAPASNESPVAYAVVIVVTLELSSGRPLTPPRVRWGFGSGKHANDKGNCVDVRNLWTPAMYDALRNAFCDVDNAVVRVRAWASPQLMTCMLRALTNGRLSNIDSPDWVLQHAGDLGHRIVDTRLPTNHAHWPAHLATVPGAV
jgi:hypothetical protein